MSSSPPLTGVAHNELASQLLQAMPEAVFLVDPHSLSILDTNSAAERLTDRSRHDLIGGVLSDIFGTSDGTDLSTIFRDSGNASQDQAPQLVQLRSAGDQSLLLNITGSVLATDGQSIGMVIVRDDTELVRLRSIEAQHHVSLAKLEEVFRALEGFAWECESTTGVFTYVSPRVEDIFGYPASEWLGSPGFFPSVIHPEDRDSILSFCVQETKDGADHTMTYRMVAADGSIKWVRDIVYLARNDAGVVTHLRGLIIDVTDDQHLRDQLQQSEERFRRLFDESPIALFEMDWSDVRSRLQELVDSGITDLRTWLEENPEEVTRLSRLRRITTVNSGGLEMFEAASLVDFLGNVHTIMREDSIAAFREHILFRFSGGRTFESDNVNYTFSGQRIYVHFTVTAAAGSEQSWAQLYFSVSNITPRKHAQLLGEGQRRVLESLASSESVEYTLGVLTAEIEQQSPYLRAALLRSTSTDNVFQMMSEGGTAEDLITLLDSVRIDSLFGDGREYSDILLSPSNRDRTQEVPELTPPAVSEIISRAAGLCGYKSGILRPVIGPENQLLGLLAVFRRESQDLTEHEEDAIAVFSDLAALVLKNDQRQKALTDRTDELQSVFETYPDALLRIDSDGTIMGRYSGNQLTEILRFSELPSRQILWHLLPREAASRIRLAVENVETGNRQETVHFSVTHEDRLREFEARFVPLPSTKEQIVVLRDVTQLRQTERALEDASERFVNLFDHSPDAIFVESPDGVVLNANQAACELHKLSFDQLIGQNMLSLVPAADRPAASTRSNALVTGGISEFESRSLQSDGHVVPVGVRISPITYDGSPAVLLHVRDISQQKNEEEQKREHERQLAHVSRLTMMGQLVAGIAHEIRQPLWSLSTFADVCVESLARPDFAERLPQICDVASKVVTEARRVNAITTRMFSFARKGTPERTVSDVHEIVNDAVELTAGRARSSRIKTTVDVEPDIPAIICDRVLIEQTLANLLNNAYAALSVHPSDSREVNIEIHSDSEDRDYITVSVRDNGPGLPDGILPEQLFEGFFTTGQSGLGIGLALSRSFVEDHGGAIRAEHLADGGMEFVFTLRVDGENNADAD